MGVALPLATPAPTPVPSVFQLTVPCYRRPGTSLCKEVQRVTHSNWLAESSDWLIAKPARILTILVIAVLVKKIVHRAIERLCDRAASASVSGLIARGRVTHQSESTLAKERRRQRAATMSSVLQSIATGVLYSIALLMSLSELTFNIGPLIASAGILGVAFGFGSQSLVKDFLSGVFMVLEDQYGVGDRVELGNTRGLVESVGLRVTRIRDLDGTVWYVRNGEIDRVGNQSQGWQRVMIDIDIAHGEDIDRVRELLAEAGQRLMGGDLAEAILERPEVWGVQALTQDAVVMRVVVKTRPAARRKVGLAFRGIIAEMLTTHGVEIGSKSTLWLRSEESATDRSITLSTNKPASDGLEGLSR
jgi:small conductance mechanosensitive channel